jgi:hypothetical protein
MVATFVRMRLETVQCILGDGVVTLVNINVDAPGWVLLVR